MSKRYMLFVRSMFCCWCSFFSPFSCWRYLLFYIDIHVITVDNTLYVSFYAVHIIVMILLCVNVHIMIFYYLLFINPFFCLFESSENNKKESSLRSDSLSYFVFWYLLFWCYFSNDLFLSIILAWHVILLLSSYVQVKKKYKNKNVNFQIKQFLEYSHELPTTDSLTSYSCPRKRILRYD